MSSNGIESLTSSLSRGCCSKLKIFAVGTTEIGQSGAERVSELLLSGAVPDVQQLDMTSNGIGPEGAGYIAAAIKVEIRSSHLTYKNTHER